MHQSIRYDSAAAIPITIATQIRSLLQAAWPDPGGELGPRHLIDPALHPTFFVLAELDQVMAYGRTIWATVIHRNQRFKLYGLGDVVTCPEHRRKGNGRRLVETATAHIQSDGDAGFLLTEPGLQAIYRRSGWEGMPGMRVVTGGYDGLKRDTLVPMMLFPSAKARAYREGFSQVVLQLPGDEW